MWYYLFGIICCWLKEGSGLMSWYPQDIAFCCFSVIFIIKLWCFLSHLFAVDLFLQRKRMLFMGSSCRSISLKFLCTSLVWGRWVTLGPLWWHHVVVEAFPLGLLADLCLRDRTPSLHPHTAHILANTYLLISTGNFSKGLWSIHSCSLNTLTLFSCLLCISHGGLQAAMTFWTVCVRDFGDTCNFLLWNTDTSCIFPIFLPCTSSLLGV